MTLRCKLTPWILLAVLLVSGGVVRAEHRSPPPVEGKGVVLIDASSGRILYGQGDEQPLPMASTTKIMTALLLLETTPLDQTLWVPWEARGVPGSKLYLEPGERYTARDMLYALMVESANDAAITIAVNVAGSVEAFVERMNRRAAELGLDGTHFANPHGLDAPEHYTSARDLARLAREAMRHPDFRRAVQATEATIPDPIRNQRRVLHSHNLFLVRYPDATGIKTGFTNAAGFCLVGSAQHGEASVIGVILGGNSAERVAADMEALVEWGFRAFAPRTLLESGETVVLDLAGAGAGERTEKTQIAVRVERPVTALLPREASVDAEDLRFEPVGDRLRVIYAGQILGEVPFRFLSETPDAEAVPEGDIQAYAPVWLRNGFVLILTGVGSVLGLFALRARVRRRQRWRFARPRPWR